MVLHGLIPKTWTVAHLRSFKPLLDTGLMDAVYSGPLIYFR